MAEIMQRFGIWLRMERSRKKLFSVLLNCFSPGKSYQVEENNNNNIELFQEEEHSSNIELSQEDNDNIYLPQSIEEEEEEEEYTEEFERGVQITVQVVAGGSLQVKHIKFR